MNKKKKRLIAIYIIAVAALGILIYVVPSLTGALTPTEVLRYDTLQVTDEEICYVIRDERVYTAAHGGSINYYIDEGVKVRAGTPILAVAGSGGASEDESKYQDIITRLGQSAVTSSDYKSEFAGIVSYYTDGFEGMFSPAGMKELTYGDIKNLKIDDAEKLKRSEAAKGEPLYKIASNSEWYITCWVKAGSIAKYEKDKTVTVQLPAGDIRATVAYIEEEADDMWQIILKSNRYYEDFAQIREAEAVIITSEYSGIIIPNKSIAVENGQAGVYVKKKSGDYSFVPIKITTSDGENSVAVESYYYDDEGKKVETVNVYDEILKNPSK